jgi:hypothetical protein
MQTQNCYFLENSFGRAMDSRLADEHLPHFACKYSKLNKIFSSYLQIYNFDSL